MEKQNKTKQQAPDCQCLRITQLLISAKCTLPAPRPPAEPGEASGNPAARPLPYTPASARVGPSLGVYLLQRSPTPRPAGCAALPPQKKSSHIQARECSSSLAAGVSPRLHATLGHPGDLHGLPRNSPKLARFSPVQ